MFAYCGNNPVARADEGGEFWHIVAGAAVGALIGGITSVIMQGIDKGFDNINLAEVALAAGAGAISGGLAASGCGLAVQVAVNSAASMASNATGQLISGQDDFDWDSMLIDGAIGAVAGLAGGAGAGNKGLTKIGMKTIRRTTNALTHKGVNAAIEVFRKGISYFGENASHIVVPLKKAFLKSTAASLSGGITKVLLY